MKHVRSRAALLLCTVVLLGTLLCGCQDKTATPEAQAMTAKRQALHDQKRRDE